MQWLLGKTLDSVVPVTRPATQTVEAKKCISTFLLDQISTSPNQIEPHSSSSRRVVVVSNSRTLGLAVLIVFAIDDGGEILNGAGAPTPNHFYAMSSMSSHNVKLEASSTGSHRTSLLAISL